MLEYHGCRHRILKACGLAILCLAIHLAMPSFACHAADKEQLVSHLYFADARHPFLVAEKRVVAHPGDPIALGRRLVRELIAGPTHGNQPTIPSGTRLRAFFILDNGTAIVDFSSQLKDNHPGSCRMEQLTLFSLVNTLVLNVPEIRRVKLLLDGAEAQTLAGHLTLDFPLTADMLLTR